MIQNLYIVNKTTCLSNDQIQKYVNAVQTQINRDFYPVWGQKAKLILESEDLVDKNNSWVLYFLDYPPDSFGIGDGILGFHEHEEGLPSAYVFAKTDIDNHLDPCVTFSHEVLELLADVFTTWCALVQINNTSPLLYSVEVCDAVEDDADGYIIDGCRVSNFVYPDWFEPTSKAKVFDHNKLCKKPLEIRESGYMPVFDFNQGQWTQIVGSKAKRFELKSKTRSAFTRFTKRNNLLEAQKTTLKE